VQRQTRDLDFFGLTPAAVDRLVPAVDRANAVVNEPSGTRTFRVAR
jgi:hypothetical protein